MTQRTPKPVEVPPSPSGMQFWTGLRDLALLILPILSALGLLDSATIARLYAVMQNNALLTAIATAAPLLVILYRQVKARWDWKKWFGVAVDPRVSNDVVTLKAREVRGILEIVLPLIFRLLGKKGDGRS